MNSIPKSSRFYLPANPRQLSPILPIAGSITSRLAFAEFGVVDAGEVNLDVGHRAYQPGEATLEELEPGA